MHGALFLPPAGAPPFPCVLHVYGGPHVQRAKHDWALAGDARSRALARAGCLVAVFDNRGSFRRGAAWERALSRRMGGPEVEDQAAAVRWLAGRGLVDPQRVAAFGWSYGGYLALRLLQRAPPCVVAGVAGAPVTDWAGYDTAYTERYMGYPHAPPGPACGGGLWDPADVCADAYAASSVLSSARALAAGAEGGGGRRLLLVHGLIDENVHVRHSWRLLRALTAAGEGAPECCDLMLLPSERHSVRDPATKAALDRRIIAFLTAALRL